MVWWIASATVLYVALTVVPIFIPDELFYTQCLLGEWLVGCEEMDRASVCVRNYRVAKR
jgi:hypothetical protein